MQSIFPFEKNRYFTYKRMRSADFSRELQYMDHKFQFLNRWTFGAGVAAGLEVQRLDTESLLVSPGMAVDRQGRYLLVDEPEVCRIQTLTGFQELQSETALLWLTYREELREPQLVTREQEENQEFSVCVERVDFHLTDMSAQPADTVDRVLYVDTMLYAGEALRVRQVIPAVLSSRDPVQLRLVLENLTLEKLDVELHYAPQLPGFHPEGAENILLDQQLVLPVGVTTIELTLLPETSAQSVAFTLSDFSLHINGRKIKLDEPVREELKVVPGDAVEALSDRLRAMSVQELWGEDDSPGVPIAGIRFIRSEDDVLLDDVVPLYQSQKVHMPAVEQRLAACRSFFRQEDSSAPIRVERPTEETPTQILERNRIMTTGVVTLNAGLHLRKGKVLCTGEILHNLGTGTVYVEFGIENTIPDKDRENQNVTDLLLGDASLFLPDGEEQEYDFDRGVRIHPEKGTFELALRLNGDLHDASLQLRWFAWRPESVTVLEENAGDLLRLEPDVVYADPGQVIHFVPVFRGMNQPCTFFVEGRKSGLVTEDGVYTAPERSGLYQLFAELQDDPGSRVSAFVIVRTQEEGGDHDSAAL